MFSCYKSNKRGMINDNIFAKKVKTIKFSIFNIQFHNVDIAFKHNFGGWDF